MSLKCGIVGLPNVGKSTLFNALTETINAEAANYPFCTIEPNVGIVNVPDQRLYELAKIAGSKAIIPTTVEIVDIAGLVKGAASGEGLGNKFLANIREADAIIHVLRCFEDENITHVNNKIDPLFDAEIVDTELILADLESVEKRITSIGKKARGGDKESQEALTLLEQAQAVLIKGEKAKTIVTDKNAESVKRLNLITSKPVLYLCNVLDDYSGNSMTEKVKKRAEEENASFLIISSKLEEEIAQIEDRQEKMEFIDSMELDEPGLNKVIKTAYKLLGLQTFFTVGPKECRGWTIKIGENAQNSAGTIHTDFAKGFIRAEVISYEDYIKYNGESSAKDAGKMRLEGKQYITQDGDVMHFRFNT